jgi:glycosyltransferase involved in cell wall biosynthesis
MSHAFRSIGHDVLLFISRSGRGLKTPDEPHTKSVPRVGPWPISSSLYGYRVGRLVASTGVDLAYARCPHSALHCGRLGVPFIYEAHNAPTNALRYRIERKLFELPTFRRLVVISRALHEEYLSIFTNLSDENLLVAHDAACLPDGADEEMYCEPRPSNPGALCVGYFGSLYPGKGIEVIKHLARLRPQHLFHVFGGAPDLIDKWSRDSSSAICFHGQIDHSRVQEYARGMDVLLLPNQLRVETSRGGDIGRFTSPLKMFEYMASGRPIIASALDNLKEVLVHGQNALLVRPDDWHGWANALDQLAADSNLRETLARSALTLLRNEFTWDIRAKKVLADVRT